MTNKKNVITQKGQKPSTAKASQVSPNKNIVVPSHPFLFNKENYTVLIGGLVLIILGFILMSGGRSENSATWSVHTSR